MIESIPVPADSKFGAMVARRLNASRQIAPVGSLAMSGPTGTGFAPLPANLRDRRTPQDPLHPWKVFAVGKSEDVDHLFEIYIPDGSITVGKLEADIQGVTEAELEMRFVFDREDDVGEESTLYLVVREGDVDEDEAAYVAELAVELDEYEGDESVTDVIPIAVLSVDTEGDYDKGVVVRQLTKAAIHLSPVGVTSLIGTDGDNESVRIDGDVVVDGSKCGLSVKTVLKEPEIEDGDDGEDPPKPIPTMEIDVSGREDAQGCDNKENWGCQEVKLPGGGIAHFLGCHPIDLSNVMTKSGGGGGDPDDPDDPPDDPDDPDKPEKDVIDSTTYVRTIHGETEDSDTVSGDLEIMSAEGSGLVVKTVAKRAPTEENPNPDGTIEFDLEGRENLPDKCSKKFGLHQIKYKDKNGDVQIYHVFSCGDIDLTEMGKLIKDVNISCSAEPGGVNTMVFNYTDGSSDTFRVQNGLNGAPGSSSGGDDPDDPDPGPVVPGGGDYLTEDDLDEVAVVTGATFKIENGKLVAKVKKKQIKAVFVKDLADENVNVCDAKELDVVTGESYDTSSHQFTNTRRKITVMGVVAAAGQTPFTATPHSSEA